MKSTDAAVHAAILALADAGVPYDVQEALIHGTSRWGIGVAPGALIKALNAALPYIRDQVLEEAARVGDTSSESWMKKRDVTANKKEARDYETMAIACSFLTDAIRASKHSQQKGGDA